MAEGREQLQSGVHENPNIVWVGQAGFEADNDRVIVLQDGYLSGYECPTCLDKNKRTVRGKECSTIDCPNCHGKGKYEREGRTIKCSECDSMGWVVCPECHGLGGTIVVPDDRKGRPTTGTIVSVGPDVKRRQLGDKVIYPSFSGHAYDLTAEDSKGRMVEIVLVILRDQEIISRMYGTLEQNQVKRSAALHTAA